MGNGIGFCTSGCGENDIYTQRMWICTYTHAFFLWKTRFFPHYQIYFSKPIIHISYKVSKTYLFCINFTVQYNSKHDIEMYQIYLLFFAVNHAWNVIFVVKLFYYVYRVNMCIKNVTVSLWCVMFVDTESCQHTRMR